MQYSAYRRGVSAPELKRVAAHVRRQVQDLLKNTDLDHIIGANLPSDRVAEQAFAVAARVGSVKNFAIDFRLLGQYLHSPEYVGVRESLSRLDFTLESLDLAKHPNLDMRAQLEFVAELMEAVEGADLSDERARTAVRKVVDFVILVVGLLRQGIALLQQAYRQVEEIQNQYKPEDAVAIVRLASWLLGTGVGIAQTTFDLRNGIVGARFRAASTHVLAEIDALLAMSCNRSHWERIDVLTRYSNLKMDATYLLSLGLACEWAQPGRRSLYLGHLQLLDDQLTRSLRAAILGSPSRMQASVVELKAARAQLEALGPPLHSRLTVVNARSPVARLVPRRGDGLSAGPYPSRRRAQGIRGDPNPGMQMGGM
jgi:hypothetical protein